MAAIVDNILNLLAAFGIAVIVLLAMGFWLFRLMKKDVEKEDQSRDSNPD